jgi:hypothetical protein
VRGGRQRGRGGREGRRQGGRQGGREARRQGGRDGRRESAGGGQWEREKERERMGGLQKLIRFWDGFVGDKTL